MHKSVQEEFVTKFAAAVETKMGQHVGDGFTETTTQGPLINKHAIEKVCMHVNDAVEKGAKLIIGGKARSDLGENFYQPTVISDVPKNALCVREETFGPVAPIIPFETEEEVLTMANASRSGLAGYFFSRDISQIFRVARNMEVGMVGVNSGLISTVEAPFGGIKESGLGIEGSTRGIDEYMNVKYVCIGDI